MRYRRQQKNPIANTCLVLVILVACCFFLILLLDYVITTFDLGESKQTESVTSVNSVTYVEPEQALQTPKDIPVDRTTQLHELFRWNFNELLRNKLMKKELKTPSDYETAVLLSNLYKELGERVNFIQIGACDGEFVSSNDPIQKLLRNTHWNGVLMEPVPFLFEKLTKNIERLPQWDSRLYLMNAAMSDKNGFQNFYIVNEEFAKEKPDETHALKYQISSFDKNHIVKHLIKLRRRGELKKEVDEYINTISVRSVTPDVVVSEFRKSKVATRDGSIDILLIDAEGYDLQVLKSFMQIGDIRPMIIIYENLHLSGKDKTEAENLLQSFGYSTWPAGWNTFGVRVAQM